MFFVNTQDKNFNKNFGVTDSVWHLVTLTLINTYRINVMVSWDGVKEVDILPYCQRQ